MTTFPNYRRAGTSGKLGAGHSAWHERSVYRHSDSRGQQEHNGRGSILGPAEEILAFRSVLNTMRCPTLSCDDDGAPVLVGFRWVVISPEDERKKTAANVFDVKIFSHAIVLLRKVEANKKVLTSKLLFLTKLEYKISVKK